MITRKILEKDLLRLFFVTTMLRTGNSITKIDRKILQMKYCIEDTTVSFDGLMTLHGTHVQQKHVLKI